MPTPSTSDAISFFDASFGEIADFESSDDFGDDAAAWEPWPDGAKKHRKSLSTAITSKKVTTVGTRSSSLGAPQYRSSPRPGGVSRSSSAQGQRNRGGGLGDETGSREPLPSFGPEDGSLWGDTKGFTSLLPPSSLRAKENPTKFPSSAVDDWFAMTPKSSTFLEQQQRMADSKSNDWGVRHGLSGDTDEDSKNAWFTANNLSLSQSDTPSPPNTVAEERGGFRNSSGGIWDTQKSLGVFIENRGTGRRSEGGGEGNQNHRNVINNNKHRLSSSRTSNVKDIDLVVVETTNLASSPRKMSPRKQSGASVKSYNEPVTPSKGKTGGSAGGIIGRFFGGGRKNKNNSKEQTSLGLNSSREFLTAHIPTNDSNDTSLQELQQPYEEPQRGDRKSVV